MSVNCIGTILFIDSHCHLDRLDLSEFNDDLSAVVNKATDAGVAEMLCVSVTLADFPKMKEKTRSTTMSIGLVVCIH